MLMFHVPQETPMTFTRFPITIMELSYLKPSGWQLFLISHTSFAEDAITQAQNLITQNDPNTQSKPIDTQFTRSSIMHDCKPGRRPS